MGTARSQLASWVSADRLFGLALAILALVVIADLHNASLPGVLGSVRSRPLLVTLHHGGDPLVLSFPLIFSRSRTQPAHLGDSRSGTAKYIILVLALAWVFPLHRRLLSMGTLRAGRDAVGGKTDLDNRANRRR